jgi:hypothetical protein
VEAALDVHIFQRSCHARTAGSTTPHKRSPAHACLPQLSKYPQLVKLEQTTNIPKAYGAIGAFSLFTIVRALRLTDAAVCADPLPRTARLLQHVRRCAA